MMDITHAPSPEELAASAQVDSPLPVIHTVEAEEPRAPEPLPDTPFIAALRAAHPDQWEGLITESLFEYRKVTDGVTWDMVDQERAELERLVALFVQHQAFAEEASSRA